MIHLNLSPRSRLVAALAVGCAFAMTAMAQGTTTTVTTTSNAAGTRTNTVVTTPEGVSINGGAPVPGTLASGATPADRVLANRILNAITADPSLAGANLTVIVDNGLVTLAGNTQTPAQAERARDIATAVAGRSVSSTLGTLQ